MSGRFLAAFRRRRMAAPRDAGAIPASPERAAAAGRSGALRWVVRDFLLIVAGVLTALGLENWNTERAERRLEAESLAALTQDVRAHLAQYDRWGSALERHMGWTSMIWGWANGTAPAEHPVEEVLLWIRLGGQLDLSTRLQDGAYQDLVNSGRLGLIRSRALREALVAYHHGTARWGAIIESRGSSASQRYAEAVAGVIPAEIAWLAATGQDRSAVDLGPILTEFRGRPAVRDALVGMAESHGFRSDIATRRLRRQAEELLELLEQELARRAPHGALP